MVFPPSTRCRGQKFQRWWTIIYSGFTYYKWWFSIAMLVYWRVSYMNFLSTCITCGNRWANRTSRPPNNTLKGAQRLRLEFPSYNLNQTENLHTANSSTLLGCQQHWTPKETNNASANVIEQYWVYLPSSNQTRLRSRRSIEQWEHQLQIIMGKLQYISLSWRVRP